MALRDLQPDPSPDTLPLSLRDARAYSSLKREDVPRQERLEDAFAMHTRVQQELHAWRPQPETVRECLPHLHSTSHAQLSLQANAVRVFQELSVRAGKESWSEAGEGAEVRFPRTTDADTLAPTQT